MSGCSRTAIFAPGEGMKRTKDSVDQNPGAHTLLRPAQVGWAGWSGSSIPGAPLNGNLPPHGSAQHLFQGTSMILAPLRGQAGHWVAQTGTACGTATAVHFLVVFKKLCEEGCRSGLRVAASPSPEGEPHPCNHFCPHVPPRPALLQAKAWPGFCLPISFSSSLPPFCA